MKSVVIFPTRSRRELIRARVSTALFVVGFVAVYAFWVWAMWNLWEIIVRYMEELP